MSQAETKPPKFSLLINGAKAKQIDIKAWDGSAKQAKFKKNQFLVFAQGGDKKSAATTDALQFKSNGENLQVKIVNGKFDVTKEGSTEAPKQVDSIVVDNPTAGAAATTVSIGLKQKKTKEEKEAKKPKEGKEGKKDEKKK